VLSWFLPKRVLTLDGFRRSARPPREPFTTHHQCLVMPGAGGLHRESGQPLRDSFLQRGPRRYVEFPTGPPSRVDPPRSADNFPCAVFLACAEFEHFGHMLTETAAWLAEILGPNMDLIEAAGPDAAILVAGVTGESADALHRVLGVPHGRIRMTSALERPVRCGRVLLPRPSLVLERYVTERQFAAVRSLIDRRYLLSPETSSSLLRMVQQSHPTGKVYLSRSQLPADVRLLIDEEQLEDELRALGWSIVYPERLPMTEQLATLAQARTLAGNLGSAFHLLMYFGRHFAPKTVIGLGLRRAMQASSVLNFVFQFRWQPIDFRHLGCLEPIDESLHRKRVQHRRFRDLRFIEQPRVIARRIDDLAAADS
jgi:hypothetical protein